MLFYSFMKLKTVFFGIIESAQFFKLVVAKIVETRIHGDMVTFFNKLVKKVIQFVLVFQAAVVYFPVNFFAECAVVILEKFCRLLKSVFLAVNSNGHFRGNHSKLLLKNSHLGLDGNIRFAEKVNAFPDVAEVSKILLSVEFFSERNVEQLAVKFVRVGLNVRLNMHAEET